jgi:dTDP-4-dehydrorhamnose reductase
MVMTHKTILVTGANGQLGMSIRKIQGEFPQFTFLFTDIIEDEATEYLDITDIGQIRDIVERHQIVAIVNCAAYTNVDKAESDYDNALLINSTAVRNLATVARENDILLVHISTDYVFGKEPYNTPCNETQTGTPTGVYGLTKLHGEQAIQELCKRYMIVRTSWLYSEYGRNFVKTILSLMREREEIRVVCDQTGTPTYATDLARALLTMVREYQGEEMSGIYHYSNEGTCSWYDLAMHVREMAGNTSCKILPCRSSEFPSPVTRPAYSVLDKSKVKETFEGKVKVPYWTDSLRECCCYYYLNQ